MERDRRVANRAGAGYAWHSRRPRPALLAAIVLGHLALGYGLARAFAPNVTDSVERSVVSVFNVTITAPEEPPPPPPPPPSEVEESAPQSGAQGSPGETATPREVVAPEPRVTVKAQPPAPRASSTGSANRSGAADAGDGTGSAGVGEGTGSGDGGSGTGNGTGGTGAGILATKPQHIAGAINAARDFPIPDGGRGVRRGTSVTVRVTVTTDGRAKDCSVFRPSPDAEADRITCRLVEERLRFKPAIDRAGNAIEAPFYWRQRWF